MFFESNLGGGSGGVDLLHSFGSDYTAVNSVYEQTGDFSQYKYLIIGMVYTSSSDTPLANCIVEKGKTENIIAPSAISTKQVYVAHRQVTFTDTKITIGKSQWDNYGKLKNIYGIRY